MPINTLIGRPLVNNKRGGKRLNAGAPRKANLAKTRTMRLTDDDYIKFINLGGVEWLRVYLNNKLNKTTIYSDNC